MKISADATEITRERKLTADQARQLRPRLWKLVRAHSFTAERRIKIAMPVDTGRARASWGHSTAPASPSDGIWEEDEKNLSLTQGSRVEYIERLNEGWSRQAPAGFIDAVEVAEQNALEEAIANEVEALFR